MRLYFNRSVANCCPMSLEGTYIDYRELLGIFKQEMMQSDVNFRKLIIMEDKVNGSKKK